MSDIQWILVILGTLLAFMQIALAGVMLTIASAHKVRKVTIPFWLGYLSTVLFIAAVLV